MRRTCFDLVLRIDSLALSENFLLGNNDNIQKSLVNDMRPAIRVYRYEGNLRRKIILSLWNTVASKAFDVP